MSDVTFFSGTSKRTNCSDINSQPEHNGRLFMSCSVHVDDGSFFFPESKVHTLHKVFSSDTDRKKALPLYSRCVHS